MAPPPLVLQAKEHPAVPAGGREGVTAAIFWLKTRARWKENHVQEHTGVSDAPVRFEITWEDSKVL